MKIKVSDYLSQFLRVQDTPYVFEIAGGMIAHFLDSFYRHKSTTIVSVHHEQAGAFAVDAYGRLTGRPSVALATSGPGATNLLTGIGSCYFDSSPALFITGQVNTHEQKGQRNIRQLGFQETDIVSMAQSITKKCYQVTIAESVTDILTEAYTCAISDRPGPVLIDIPMNIQRAQIEVPEPVKLFPAVTKLSAAAKENIHMLFDVLTRAKQPLLLIGGGVNAARCKTQLLQFLHTIKIPAVTSLLGLDIVPYDDPFRVGFIGSYGNRWANIALGNADVLIVLGSRLDIRQTGADVKNFAAGKTIFHVDCEAGEINNRVLDCIPIQTDLRNFFEFTQKELISKKLPQYLSWQQEIAALKQQWLDVKELSNFEGINPNIFMHQLSQSSKQAAGYVVDVGAHQMWAAQSLEIYQSQFFITSGGMGAMGFSLPGAIGATLALNKKPVVVVVGDGSLQTNIQELQTVVRNKLPIKIVVINNQSLGMITQFQDSYFEGRYQSTYWGYSAPDFCQIAQAYGIMAKQVRTANEIADALKWLWQQPNTAALLEIMIQPHLPVYPKIAFGKPLTEMEPLAKPMGMEAT